MVSILVIGATSPTRIKALRDLMGRHHWENRDATRDATRDAIEETLVGSNKGSILGKGHLNARRSPGSPADLSGGKRWI